MKNLKKRYRTTENIATFQTKRYRTTGNIATFQTKRYRTTVKIAKNQLRPVKIIHNGSFVAESVDLNGKGGVLQRIDGYERFLCNENGVMNDFKPIYG